jgi:hypothetical protein
MNMFVKRHAELVTGMLQGFDRVLLRAVTGPQCEYHWEV